MKHVKLSQETPEVADLLGQVCHTQEPLMIEGAQYKVIVVSEDSWRTIQDSLYLLSIPGMRESIQDGMEEAQDELTKISDLDWENRKGGNP